MSFTISRSGERVQLTRPNLNYNIDDIAHSLAHQNRYNGHTVVPYSVAQHCCLGAQYVKHKGFGPRSVLRALLHDAAEAYMGDIISPVKSMMPPALLEAERRLMMDIFVWAASGLPLEDEPLTDKMMDEIDQALFLSERRALFPPGTDWGDDDVPPPMTFRIEAWSPMVAKSEFLKIFRTHSLRS